MSARRVTIAGTPCTRTNGSAAAIEPYASRPWRRTAEVHRSRRGAAAQAVEGQIVREQDLEPYTQGYDASARSRTSRPRLANRRTVQLSYGRMTLTWKARERFERAEFGSDAVCTV